MDLISTASDIKRGAKKLEWIIRLAESLEEIGSIEQAATEAERKKFAADKSLADIGALVADRQAELQVVEETTQSMQEKFNAELKEQREAIRTALETCKAEIQAAKDQATSIIESAHTQAEREINTANNQVAASNRELVKVENMIDEAHLNLDAVNQQVAEAKAKAKALFNTFQ